MSIEFSGVLQGRMENRGLSVKAVCYATGRARLTITPLLAGEMAPNIGILRDLSLVLQIPLADLLVLAGMPEERHSGEPAPLPVADDIGRHGKPGPVAGSVDLNSLKLPGNSRSGDVSYGTSWTSTNVTAVVGIPDISGDRIPDLWARNGPDGTIRVYHPSATNTNAFVKVIIAENWSTFKAFG
ncbi:helix-turn-helix domain-containing protein [Micromonospora sp. NPDC004704]